MSSLRNKIISSYSLSNLAIITIALIVFADLNYLHNQITEGENVKDLLTATQQLQNDERNLYQCQEPDAYNRLHSQLDKTEGMYQQVWPIFEEVVEAEELNTLSQRLEHYRVLLASLQDQCSQGESGLLALAESRDGREHLVA
jgi:hypothetical protein